MNLNREKFLAVIMTLGALTSAVGCNKQDAGKAAEATDGAAASAAPANESAPVAVTPIVQQVPARSPTLEGAFRPASYPVQQPPVVAPPPVVMQARPTVVFQQPAPDANCPPAPPPRFERQTRMPSRDHVWVGGKWSWTGREYLWIEGRWELRAGPTQAPPAPRFEQPGRAPNNRTVWIPGYWKWTGRDYLWVGGHWDTLRNGFVYVHGHWDRRDRKSVV